MKKIFTLIVAIFFISGIVLGKTFESNENFDIIMSDNVLEEKSKYLDINNATKQELLRADITLRLAGLILDYRDKTGGFDELSELKRIKGIGPATYEKLSKKLKVISKAKKKPLYINLANDELLTYYGFDKKDIKEIRKYEQKNGRINSNLDLMKILSKKDYEKYKNIIKYDKF